MRRRRLVTVIMRRGKLTQLTGRLTQRRGRLTQLMGRLTQLTGRPTKLNQSRRNPIYLSRDLCGITKSGTVDPWLYYCQVGSTVSSDADCRSTGHEFDPGPIPYFCGDWSWNNFYGHSPRSADSRRVVVSYKGKFVHKVLVNPVVKL